MSIGLGPWEIIILLIPITLIITLIVIWCKEFIFMMALGDSDYPGRYDKTLWFITFFILSVFAPFLFRGWKNAIKASVE